MRRPRMSVLNVLALLSPLVLAVLLVGYFGEVRVLVTSARVKGPTPSLRVVLICLERGRIRWDMGVAPLPTPFASGTSVRWSRRFWSPPDVRRSLWEFDAHSLSIASPPGMRAFIVACPIWCVAAPCLIAPMLWLRRRRRRTREDVQGFEVSSGESIRPAAPTV